MNAVFNMVAVVAILGLSLALFGYIRLIRLQKLVAISNKHIDTDNLDTIYLLSMLVGGILFVLGGMTSIATWQTLESKYENCIQKTHDTGYCSRYLKD